MIEFARHVLQHKNANSSEFDKCEHQVVRFVISCILLNSVLIVKVIEMPEHNPGAMGG